MLEILQMKSVPILNIMDFYEQFDILDMLRGRESFARLAKGHFRWSGSINLHHLDVVLAMADTDTVFEMESASDYWTFQGKWSKKLPKEVNDLPEYLEQTETASLIYQKYASKLTGNDSKIIMLVIAGVLLARKTESCLDGISAEQLKSAYDRVDHSSDGDGANGGTVVNIHMDSRNRSVTLPAFHGTYRIPMDSTLRPSHERRVQTYIIRAEADVRLEFVDDKTGETKQEELMMREQIYCLGLDGIISRILPNEVTNGGNTMLRKADGIYLNGKKCSAIPSDVSSFAVGMNENVPQFIYVRDGHIHYGNYDDFDGKQRVSEDIAVISEVQISGSKVTIIRNDGKVWDGKKFC